MRPLVHILEPTARSAYGHHLHYVECIASKLETLDVESIAYLAVQAVDEPLVQARPILKRFVFKFRYSQDFDQVHNAHVTGEDPVGRVLIAEAKRAASELHLEQSRIASENIRYRIRSDLDRLSATYGMTRAEERTVRLANDDVTAFASFLRSQAADRDNVVFLPTGEFFLLQALLAQAERLSPMIRSLHIRMWNFLSLERNSFDLYGLAAEVTEAYRRNGVEVYLYGEVPWAVDKLAEIEGAKVGYLDINSFSPVPRFVWGSDSETAIVERAQTRIFFPGSYRRYPDKGLEFLAEAVGLATHRPDIALVFQEPDWDVIGVDRDAVAHMPNVTVLPRIVERGAYEHEFLKADYICLPYDGVTWLDQFRGSGVILEGILFEKPVIIKSGTTLDQYATMFSIIYIDDARHLFARVGAGALADDLAAAKANRRKYADLVAGNEFIRSLTAKGAAEEPAASPQAVARSGRGSRR